MISLRRIFREAARRSNHADATRRMLALALVLEGYGRGEAGNLCGMDRQTLRDWVLRYNAEGIGGLRNRMASGPKPRLTPEQEALVAALVRKGPDPTVDGVVRWPRVDLACVIKTRFNVTLAAQPRAAHAAAFENMREAAFHDLAAFAHGLLANARSQPVTVRIDRHAGLVVAMPTQIAVTRLGLGDASLPWAVVEIF